MDKQRTRVGNVRMVRWTPVLIKLPGTRAMFAVLRPNGTVERLVYSIADADRPAATPAPTLPARTILGFDQAVAA